MKLIADNLIDFEQYQARANSESAHVRPASSWKNMVLSKFHGENQKSGARLPWRVSHDKVRFRPGEVSVWAGVNGHGKSMLLSHAVLGFAAQDERICIASMEMRPDATMYRMTRQAIGKSYPTDDVISEFSDWTDDRLWIYDQQGTVKANRIIALGNYCSEELKIDHLVIDSLMKCGIGVDDYNGQKKFVDELCALGKDTGLHIHLVAHSRKGEKESDKIDKFDIKGASEITDQVDNVMLVWRNKRKEEDMQRTSPTGNHDEEPDALLSCVKQRHGEWEGKIRLWFDRQSMTYNEKDRRALDWVGLQNDLGVSKNNYSSNSSREPGSDDE